MPYKPCRATQFKFHVSSNWTWAFRFAVAPGRSCNPHMLCKAIIIGFINRFINLTRCLSACSSEALRYGENFLSAWRYIWLFLIIRGLPVHPVTTLSQHFVLEYSRPCFHPLICEIRVVNFATFFKLESFPMVRRRETAKPC